MAGKLSVFTDDQIAVIRQVVRDEKNRLGNTANRPRVPPNIVQAPETYVAYTSAGIPKMEQPAGTSSFASDSDVPSYDDCILYQLVGDDPAKRLEKMESLTKRAYNLSTSTDVPPASFFLVTRDKLGVWWTANILGAASECDELTYIRDDYRRICVGGYEAEYQRLIVIECGLEIDSTGWQFIRMTCVSCTCPQPPVECPCPTSSFCLEFDNGYQVQVVGTSGCRAFGFVQSEGYPDGTGICYTVVYSGNGYWAVFVVATTAQEICNGLLISQYELGDGDVSCDGAVVPRTGYPDEHVTISLGTCGGGSGTGSGTGTGAGPTFPGCCEHPCLWPSVPGVLNGTVTNKVGAYTALPDTIDFICVTQGGGGGDTHTWDTSFTLNYGSVTLTSWQIKCPTGNIHLFGTKSDALSTLDTPPEAGYTCGGFSGAFSAVYLVDDGAGNTCTLTITG